MGSDDDDDDDMIRRDMMAACLRGEPVFPRFKVLYGNTGSAKPRIQGMINTNCEQKIVGIYLPDCLDASREMLDVAFASSGAE